MLESMSINNILGINKIDKPLNLKFDKFKFLSESYYWNSYEIDSNYILDIIFMSLSCSSSSFNGLYPISVNTKPCHVKYNKDDTYHYLSRKLGQWQFSKWCYLNDDLVIYVKNNNEFAVRCPTHSQFNYRNKDIRPIDKNYDYYFKLNELSVCLGLRTYEKTGQLKNTYSNGMFWDLNYGWDKNSWEYIKFLELIESEIGFTIDKYIRMNIDSCQDYTTFIKKDSNFANNSLPLCFFNVAQRREIMFYYLLLYGISKNKKDCETLGIKNELKNIIILYSAIEDIYENVGFRIVEDFSGSVMINDHNNLKNWENKIKRIESKIGYNIQFICTY